MTRDPRPNPLDVEAAFQAVPETQVAEIVDGELVVSPRPASRHARAATRLAHALSGFDRGPSGPESPGGWILLFEPELHLGRRPDKLVPDLAGWRRSRMPELPYVAAFTLAPDWVCEVLSAGTMRHDRVRKQRIYAREGVGHVWHLDPEAQTLEVFRLEHGRWLRVGEFEAGERVRAEPFEALDFALDTLWAR